MTTPEYPELSASWHLTSDRLFIRRLNDSPEHCNFIVELYNSPLFIEGEGKTGIDTPEKAHKMIGSGFVAQHFAKNGHAQYVMYLLSDDPENNKEAKPIGNVSLMRGHYTCPDIGFALLPDYTGKGYAKEAGQRVIDYAITSKENGGLGYSGVFGFAASKNEKSRKVCERLGLEFRGLYNLEAFGGQESAVYASQGMAASLKEYGIGSDRVDV
jgi:GNAT superfamily N-acetyltransferase